MDLKIDRKEEQVTGTLNTPSNLPAKYGESGIRLHVRLILHMDDLNEDEIHALSVMRNSCGINILHARLVQESPPYLLAWVEPYTGKLMDYLKSKSFGVPQLSNSKHPIVLPTALLGSAVRYIVDGVEQLRLSGHYHGNFTFWNTYYKLDTVSGNLTVKLADFVKKDWSAVARGLKEIGEFARQLNTAVSSSLPNIDCCQLYGLIDMMGCIGPINAEYAFQAIKRQPFFWGEKDRKEFYICVIPKAMKKDAFQSKLKKATSFGLPWSDNNSHLFLKLILTMSFHDKLPSNFSRLLKYSYLLIFTGKLL
ncbi:hypothetical protein BRADI_1g72735v3, partial [Brachypodium distachyon]